MMDTLPNQKESTQKYSRKRIAIYLLMLVLFFTIVPLLLIEGAVRTYIWYKYGVPGKSYGLWCYDKEFGAIHCHNGYNTMAQTNEYGFRNTENVREPKPIGALRIIAYGGSTTFCYNLLNGETWSDELEKQLRKNHDPQDQVLNAGAIMWSIGQSYARAKQDIPVLKPDYVIIYDGINDQANAQLLELEGKPMKALVEKGEYGVFSKNLDQSRWVKRNLALVRLMDYVITPLLTNNQQVQQVDIPTTPDPYVMENYLHTLSDFLELAKANGATPIFLVQANGHNDQVAKYLTSYSRNGIQTATQEGAIVLDAQVMVDGYHGQPMDLFHYTGVHYSRLGAEMLGEFLYQQINWHVAAP